MNIFWDDEPGGNVEHIAENDVTVGDVEHVLNHADATDFSKSSGRPCVFGYTPDGRFILVIYEDVGDDLVMPITAYEVAEP